MKIIYPLAAIVLVAVSQPLLVKHGHPGAIWLWCSALNLCEASVVTGVRHAGES